MMHCLKPFQCLACNSNFCNRAANCYKENPRTNNLSNYPLILKCGHTVCECCVQNVVNQRKIVICAKCQYPTEFDGEASAAKLLPDLHVLGSLSANQKQMLPSAKMKMASAGSFIGKLHHEKECNLTICDECTQREALWNCVKCEESFCNTCFDHIHSRGVKSLRKHEKKSIERITYNTLIKSVCKEHSNRNIEFYCNEDDELACSHCCVTGKHKGHNVMTLVQKNACCREELKTVLDEALIIKKRMKHTSKKLVEIIPSERQEFSHVIQDVRDTFHKLHSLLQLRETYLISQVEAFSNSKVLPLENMHQELLKQQKELENLQFDADKALKNSKLPISYPILIQKLKELSNVPHHLVMSDSEELLDSGLEVCYDIDLPHILKNYGNVIGNVCQRYFLKQTAELPEDYVLEDNADGSSLADTESVTSKSELCSEECVGMSSPPTHSLDSGIPLTTLKHSQFSISQTERVVVSHIRHPGKFWVQKCTETRKLKIMSDAINKWCTSPESKKQIPTRIIKGELYLVRYGADKKWYRGRARKLILEDTNEDSRNHKNLKKSKKSNENISNFIDDADSLSELEITTDGKQMVEVSYIDYGNTEIVSVSSMRNIQTRFLNLAGIAKECCLYEVYPSEKDKWSNDAIKMFAKFVGNKEVAMMVIEERNGIFYVDLSHSAAAEIANDIPVSVRDALVFLDHGYFTESEKTIGASAKRNTRIYLPAEKLCSGMKTFVILSHVESPSLFYVQQVNTANKLSHLINEMNSTYRANAQNSLYRIYIPHVGMICAAQYSLDKKWYRAEVINLSGGAMVEVQYIDFGNTEILHHRNLRKLFDRFNKLSKQAIKCSLSDVISKDQEDWPAEAKTWLVKIAFRKQLLLKSQKYLPEENKAEVVLFDTQEDVDISINALMVEEEIASSSGESSLIVRFEKPVAAKPVAAKPLPLLTPVERNIDICPTTDRNVSELPTAEVKREDPVSIVPKQDCKNNLFPIYISHIESPSLFWIRLVPPERTETKLNMLMDSIQCVYQNVVTSIDSIRVGKVCAALNTKDGKWYRGTISEINDSTAKVRFSDYGRIEEVPINNLRNLHDEFQVEKAFAVKCNLAGIQPAGDRKDWSQIACESFLELTHSHEILYLVKKGEIVDKSLPSDILFKEIRRGGALEADTLEYTSITEKLVEKGVALRPRRSHSNTPLLCSPNFTGLTAPEEVVVLLPPIPSFVVVKKVIKKKTVPAIQWLTSVTPAEQSFEAMVTYVDHGGNIYLHDIKEGSVDISLIQKTLQYQYSKDIYEKLTIPPAIGQACIAKFILDGDWYRGEILSHTPDVVKVLFVDYGNIENVKLEDIRTDVVLTEMPRQAIECRLHGIKPITPNETWTIDVLNFLHSAIVEQPCHVDVRKDPELGEPLEIDLTLSNGINVGMLLMTMGEATTDNVCDLPESSDEVVERTDDEALLFHAFKKASPLREGEPFQVCVTQMLEPNLVFLQQLQVPEPTSDYDKMRNIEYNEFLSVMEELALNADGFPLVDSPHLGTPYCAKYTFDDRWYRCEVTNVFENDVSVLYVDYGNTEIIAVERLRKLEGRYVDFPVQSHMCKLSCIEPIGDAWSSDAINSMVECLFHNDQSMYARVVEFGEVCEVQLLTRDEDEAAWNLIYQDCIDKKLIKLQE